MLVSVNSGNVAEAVIAAVSYSALHTEIVTLLVPTADHYEALRAMLVEEADDYVDVTPSEVDAWGTDDDGAEWRVQARTA